MCESSGDAHPSPPAYTTPERRVPVDKSKNFYCGGQRRIQSSTGHERSRIDLIKSKKLSRSPQALRFPSG